MRRILGSVAACGLALCLLAACVSFGPALKQPSLVVTDLPGTWVSGDGASITFTDAGVFTVTKFDFFQGDTPMRASRQQPGYLRLPDDRLDPHCAD